MRGLRGLLPFLLCVSLPCCGAVVKIGCVTGHGNGGTTATLNAVGASLLSVRTADQFSASITVADSGANTWNTTTSYGGDFSAKIYYAYQKSGGPLSLSSTQTATVGGNFPFFELCAWSGTKTSASPLDVQNGAAPLGVHAVATGSVTPSVDGSLILTTGAFGLDGGTFTIDSSFTVSNQSPLTGGSNYAGAFAHLIQSTAGAVNPTWTLGSGANQNPGANIVVFAPAPTAGTASQPIIF